MRRNPEVHDFDHAVGGQHQVRRLDIAVNDFLLVSVVECGGGLVENIAGKAQVGNRPLGQVALKGAAFDQLHRNVG